MNDLPTDDPFGYDPDYINFLRERLIDLEHIIECARDVPLTVLINYERTIDDYAIEVGG